MLFNKLNHDGFSNTPSNLLANYLQNPMQYVDNYGSLSNTIIMIAGVP